MLWRGSAGRAPVDDPADQLDRLCVAVRSCELRASVPDQAQRRRAVPHLAPLACHIDRLLRHLAQLGRPLRPQERRLREFGQCEIGHLLFERIDDLIHAPVLVHDSPTLPPLWGRPAGRSSPVLPSRYARLSSGRPDRS